MTSGYRKIFLFSSVIMLAGCAQNHEVPQLKNQVVELKQKLALLVDQASALKFQNQLNQDSARGVYLLPLANNAARLQSSVGELSISLGNVTSEANGSQATLAVRTLSGQYLPGFTAILEWGELDSTTGMPLSAEAQSQRIQSPPTLLAKTEQLFALRLSGLTPEQLGYIRLHSIAPLAN